MFVDDAQIVAPQRKVKTAVIWDLRPWPWYQVGPEFRAECEAIASGVTPETVPDLRRLRVKRGLTQRALAELVGCNQSVVLRAEHGGGGKWAVIIRKALEG
jgi:hypothetical protein